MLDLNLGGGSAKFDLAHALRVRGVPVIFFTGYDPEPIPAEMADMARFQKLTPMNVLLETISRL